MQKSMLKALRDSASTSVRLSYYDISYAAHILKKPAIQHKPYRIVADPQQVAVYGDVRELARLPQ